MDKKKKQKRNFINFFVADILEDLDDLTASTPSVMNLLAEFYSQPLIHTLATDQPLPELIPRVFIFFLFNFIQLLSSYLIVVAVPAPHQSERAHGISAHA